MKNVWFAYSSTIFLLTATLCVGLWIWAPAFLSNTSSVFFPIPLNFALPSNAQVATLDVWGPAKDIANTKDPLAPEITATAALSFDLTTNSYVYTKDITAHVPMASLTKIMTAIVALEHPTQDDKYVVTQDNIVGNNMMGVSVGEVLSQEELLYGLVLPSGNDAAEVFASNFTGGRSRFIVAMNEKVQTLGISDTHFTNPSGLEGDGDQHTTAYDLLVMTHYALSHFPLFTRVVSTIEKDIPATPTHKEFFLSNETNLLTSYPGVRGVKDGYTPEAGLCLVTYLKYGGHEILAVILGSDDRRGEMKELLDYSLKKVGITPPHHG